MYVGVFAVKFRFDPLMARLVIDTAALSFWGGIIEMTLKGGTRSCLPSLSCRALGSQDLIAVHTPSSSKFSFQTVRPGQWGLPYEMKRSNLCLFFRDFGGLDSDLMPNPQSFSLTLSQALLFPFATRSL